MVNTLKYQKELEHLKSEHASLETQIAQVIRNKVVDQFKINDLKKKKLMLKEAIAQIENLLFAGDDAA